MTTAEIAQFVAILIIIASAIIMPTVLIKTYNDNLAYHDAMYDEAKLQMQQTSDLIDDMDVNNCLLQGNNGCN